MRLREEFTKGICKENPTFKLALGLCPALAVSTSVINGLGMGLAAGFVLFSSNIIVSLLRKFIPREIRIPCFIVIIATFVTLVELFMAGFVPVLARSLGIFVPLIVVNCVILGRAEAFASRKPVLLSMLDGLGMGAGFALALVLISAMRELLGTGRFFNIKLLGNFDGALIFILAPGALLIMGFLLALFNIITEKGKGAGIGLGSRNNNNNN